MATVASDALNKAALRKKCAQKAWKTFAEERADYRTFVKAQLVKLARKSDLAVPKFKWTVPSLRVSGMNAEAYHKAVLKESWSKVSAALSEAVSKKTLWKRCEQKAWTAFDQTKLITTRVNIAYE